MGQNPGILAFTQKYCSLEMDAHPTKGPIGIDCIDPQISADFN